MKVNEEDIRKFLKSIPDHFDILKEGIDMKTHKEYLDYSHSFDHGELTEKQTINLGNMLCDARSTIDSKKKIVTLLAHLGTISAFRQIEKYYNQPENDIKNWTALALQECRMFLESSLMDESAGFISTGLGGTNDKLRYYFLVLPLTDKQFTSIQHRLIKDEFLIIAKELKCIVETVDNSDTYVGLTVLVPMNVAIGVFIEKGIQKCNELGEFVFEFYYVTNQDIPDNIEITEIIKIVRAD
jgi:hypothetical protein